MMQKRMKSVQMTVVIPPIKVQITANTPMIRTDCPIGMSTTTPSSMATVSRRTPWPRIAPPRNNPRDKCADPGPKRFSMKS